MITKIDFHVRVNQRYPDATNLLEGIIQYDKYLTSLLLENVYNVKNEQLINYFLIMDYCLEDYKQSIPIELLEEPRVINQNHKKETIAIKGQKASPGNILQLLSLVRLIPQRESLSPDRKVELLTQNCTVYRPHLWNLVEQSLASTKPSATLATF